MLRTHDVGMQITVTKNLEYFQGFDDIHWQPLVFKADPMRMPQLMEIHGLTVRFLLRHNGT